MRLVTTLLLLFGLSACAGAESEPDSTAVDTLVLDSLRAPIPPRWHNRKLDSTQIAKPEDLVRLPDSLTFEDYRIYLRPAARDAFVRMAEAGKVDSVDLIVDSGFRSPGFQRRIIRRRLEAGDSIEKILTMVAPPGYSEHHTGLAVDLVPSEALFAKSKAYAWLKEHAADFGFFETLPQEAEDGMSWEPWHWRYQPE